jgi:opacity protein-like surface antigen
MNPRLLAVMLGIAAMLFVAAASAQEAAGVDPLEAEALPEPETWQDYTVKAYTIRIFGGWFGGSEYLNLPVKGPRTFEVIGANRVMGYDGTWWELDELDYRIYDGPVKRINDGYTLGLTIGQYLADHFHIDVTFAYSATEAVLTMVNTEDSDNQFREEIDRDSNVQVYRASLQLTYDLDTFSLLGFNPYIGFGFGGVINRFSNLPDVGELFLTGTAGFQRRFGNGTAFFVQASLSSFSMSRDELFYTTSVTYTDVSAGISFYFDVVPPEIRAQHEAQQAERRRRR